MCLYFGIQHDSGCQNMEKLSKIWGTQMLFQAESWQVTMIPKPLNTPILWLISPCDQNLGEWTVHNLWSAFGFERLVIRGHPDNGQGMEGNFYLWWWSQDLWNPCGSSFLTFPDQHAEALKNVFNALNLLELTSPDSSHCSTVRLVNRQSPPGRIEKIVPRKVNWLCHRVITN